MKILLDESLPRKLKHCFPPGHNVITVTEMGWPGQKNSNLLQLMVAEGFTLFVTVDRNIQYQQHTEKLPLTLIVFCAANNRLETLSLLIPKIFERLAAGSHQQVIDVF